VDPALPDTDAWTVGSEHIEPGVGFESRVEVEAHKLDDERLHVLIRNRRSEYGSDRELVVTFVPDSAPDVSVKGKSYHLKSGQSWHDGQAGGTVLFSSDTLPSEGGEDLVIAYTLVAHRSGSPVESAGKVAIRPEDLR
jgi:hypothetical protein